MRRALKIADLHFTVANIFRGWNRLFEQALSVLKAGHVGLWLGLLRRQQLYALTAIYYDRSGQYVDPTYNTSGLFGWERAAVTRYFPDEGSILVPACGGGRELDAFARAGYRTTGFDPDERYVGVAQSADWGCVAHAPIILHALPDEVPVGVGVHDVCVLGWGAYTHLAGRAERIAFLKRIGEVLKPGAPLLLSFWSTVRSNRQLRISHAIAVMMARLSFNSRRPEFGDWLGRHFAHYFDETMVREELQAAGFEPQFIAMEPYGHAVARRC